jgi:predicted dinucleotide-binding enzyme
MKVGVLGSGMVGQYLAGGLIKNGHSVTIGTRDPKKLDPWMENLQKYQPSNAKNGCVGSFEEAAKFGELLVLCCKGDAVESVINLAKKENFTNKVVIDTTNPLKFTSQTAPPEMLVAYPHSLGKKIQGLIPEAKVVKAFNTIPSNYMIAPAHEEGMPDLFVCGNDNAAKEKVKELARAWGWSDFVDMGNIDQAYILEALGMAVIVYSISNNRWTNALKMLKK